MNWQNVAMGPPKQRTAVFFVTAGSSEYDKKGPEMPQRWLPPANPILEFLEPPKAAPVAID